MLNPEPREVRDRRRRISRGLRIAWQIGKWTFVIGLAAGIAVGCWKFYGWQQQRHAQAFLREALRAERDNRPADAITAAQGCIQLAPDELRAYWLWAILLRREGQLASADECLAAMIAANPHNGRAYMYRGRHLLETGRAALAAADLQQAQLLAPLDREVLLLAADYWVAQKQPEKAAEFARRLRDEHANDPAISARLAALEMSLGRREDALAAYRAAVETDAKNERLLFVLVDLLCQEKQFNEVRSLLARAAGAECDPAILQLLEARLAHAQGRWKEALNQFEKLNLGSHPRPEYLQQRYAWEGDCHARMGNPAAQLAAWRQAVQADPQTLPLRRQYIDALTLAGRIDEAVTEARELKAAGGAAPEDDLYLAHLLLLAARRVPAERRNWDEPDKLIAAVSQTHPTLTAADLLRAELCLAQQRPAAAAAVFPPPAEKWPRRIECWLAQAWISVTQDDGAAAFASVEGAKQALGDSLAWRRAAAAYLVWQLGPTAAPQLRTLGEDLAKLPPAERLELMATLAWACLRCGDHETAAKFAAEVAGAKENDSTLWLLQFEVALRANRLGGLERLLQQVEQAEGNGPHWNYGKAVHLTLLARGGQLQFYPSAAAHAAQACRLAPAWPWAPLLAAEIDATERRVSAACHYYAQAVSRGETRPTLIRQILEYLDAQQHYIEVDQIVRKLGAAYPPLLTSPVGRTFAVSLPNDDFTYARRAAAQAVQQTASAANLLWLARLLEISSAQRDVAPQRAASFRELAEDLFRKAADAEPAAAAPRMALVQFYLHTGRAAQARAALNAAAEKISATQLICFQADAEQLLGNHGETERLWRKALASGPGEEARVRAVEYLQQVGGEDRVRAELEAALVAQPVPDAADLAAVRRRLAWELTTRGNAEDRQRADRLLAENLAQQPGDVRDEQLRALVLATGAKQGWRHAAIEVLEGLSAVDWRRTPEQKFFLVQLCRADGDLPRARRHLEELVTRLPNEPRYVAALIEILIQAGDVRAAEQQAARLETLAPESFLTAAAQAEVAVAHDRLADVSGIIQRFLVRPDRQPADPVACLEQVTDRLQRMAERFAQRKGAAQAAPLFKTTAALRRQLIDREPQAALRWARRQSAQGEFAAALATIEGVLTRVTTDQLAEVLTEFASAAKTPAQQEAFEKFLSSTLQTLKRPAAVVAAAAVFYAERQQYERAEAALREVIGKTPRHLPALNNLALHLALSHHNPDESLELVQRAIQIAGEKPALLDTRAMVRLSRGETDDALADLERAIAAAPKSIWFFHKARVLEARKDSTAARAADDQARDLGLNAALLHPLERAKARAILAPEKK